MKEENKIIDNLIIKYLEGSLSEKEQEALNTWIHASEKNQVLFEKLTDSKWINVELEKLYQFNTYKGWEKVTRGYSNFLEKQPLKIVSHGKSISRFWQRMAVAASILLVLGTGSYFLIHQTSPRQSPATSPVVASADIKAPDKNKAKITLANGKIIYLDSLANGTLAQQQGVNVVKLSDGQLAYKGNATSPDFTYNTLYNPRGSKVVSLILSDGTKVWLNSGSSLRYPITFFGKERKVEMSGEAYFEVAKNAQMPFKAVVNQMEVEVLGTHFNINAYPDEEAIKTTLLEGRVNVSEGSENSFLSPGQQAQIENHGNQLIPKIMVQTVDVEKVIAWKSGIFEFDNTGLPAIMRQISRWYNVDVEYKSIPGTEKFGGAINKNVPLSNVLKMLEENGVKFELSENKIIVKP
jgi:transmembrane sensor